MVEVYKAGIKVLVSADPDSIEATISTVAIHDGDYVQYECVWWNGLTRSRDWFSETDIIEVVNEDKPKTKIGFH